MKMKKILSCLLVAVMIMVLMPQAITVFAHEYSDDRVNYLVVAKNEASYNVINREYENEKCEEKTVSDESIVLSLTEGEAESIEEYAGTAYIEKDILFKEFSEDIAPEDLIEDFLGGETECAEEDYPANIYMVNGDNVNLASEENIVVGVLDSGIANHSDLNVTKRVCLIPDMYVDNNLFSYDLSGHGTGVAGVIGAKNDDKGIIGIYENVELYSIQVLTPMGEAPLSRIVAGIDWAIENGVDVLNMSFGTSVNSEILYDAIVRAANSGMVLVAAAGNTEYATQYPAKYSEVISVGSVDGSGNISDFSAKDNYVDIYAPGESIISTTIVGGYTAANGTSLAAPHVTAAAALIKAVNRQRTTEDIKNLILATANKSVEGNEKGILDIENMLAHADDFDYTNNQTTYQNTEPFDEYDEETVVVGSWWASKHQKMTEDVYKDNNVTWDQALGATDKLKTEYLRLMAATSYLADQLYGNTVKAAVKNDAGEFETKTKRMYGFYPLHAYAYKDAKYKREDGSYEDVKDYNSNYVADTKFLYRLARCYAYYDSNKNEDISDDIDKIKKTSTKHGANVTELEKIVKSKDVLYTNASDHFMKVTIEEIDENGDKVPVEVLKKQSNDERTDVKGIIYMNVVHGIEESTTVARGFKILGLALHLAGDVYAHRSQIPIWTTNPGEMFAEDFDDFNVLYDFMFDHENTKPYDDYKMRRFLRYRDNKSEICDCFYCFRMAVANGIVEFRDISSFHDYDDPSDKEDNIRFYKDDKTEFCEGRYKIATTNATNKMISLFLTNNDFSIYTFVPNDPGYNVKLNNLKGYIIRAGVKWDELEPNHPGLPERIEGFSTDEEI